MVAFCILTPGGISGLYNNNSVDGVDNNQAFFSAARGRTRTSHSVSQASIKEFPSRDPFAASKPPERGSLGNGGPADDQLSRARSRASADLRGRREVTVDRLVATDLTVSTSYLYSGGTHLPLFTDANMPAASNTLFGPHAQVGVKFSQ